MTSSTTLTSAASAPPAQLGTAEPILFVQATIIDGSEDAVPYTADVLVADGLIAKIGSDLLANLTHANASANPDRSSPELAAIRQVDARGWVLCPGFIDMHAHSDLYLLTHPAHEPKISQGCTLEVIGQDGISYAPVRSRAQLTAIRQQIAGWNGNPTDEECAPGGKGRLAGIGMFEWETVGEYLDCLERNRTATNVCMLVPQGNLRLLACGPTDKVASAAEIEEQVGLLRQAMDDGAVGMSRYVLAASRRVHSVSITCASRRGSRVYGNDSYPMMGIYETHG